MLLSFTILRFSWILLNGSFRLILLDWRFIDYWFSRIIEVSSRRSNCVLLNRAVLVLFIRFLFIRIWKLLINWFDWRCFSQYRLKILISSQFHYWLRVFLFWQRLNLLNSLFFNRFLSRLLLRFWFNRFQRTILLFILNWNLLFLGQSLYFLLVLNWFRISLFKLLLR